MVSFIFGECPCGVMVKVLDSGIVISEFEPQSRYYVHFRTNSLRKGMDRLVLLAMGFIVPLLFWKDRFGMK